MDYSKSFTYVISSNERTNTAVQQTAYNIDFGGFGGDYRDYHCEVLNLYISGQITATPTQTGYFLFTCENLNDNGIFINNKLTGRECLISVVPLTATIDAISQGDGSTGVIFRVNNCQMKRPVIFKFYRPDYSLVQNTIDINVGANQAETRWVLVLKMTPYINF